MRVLLVEDDKMLGEAMQSGLLQKGHAVDWVRDGDAAWASARSHDYAAVLLDLGLPKRDGMQVLRGLRAHAATQTTPVLIVTARDALTERVAGLNAGADDYILKPFDLDELDARLRAVVRRAHGRASAQLSASGVVLDVAAKRVSLQGQEVSLTALEYAVVVHLMERAGRVVSRDELETALYAWNREVGSNTVEVYVSQIRRKLGRDFIVTRRGFGYCVEAEACLP
jgi:DNA-binding response OmpR family regulator